MKNNPRVIIDTNVLISGLFGIKNSPSSQILRAYRNQKIILASSPAILEEIVDVINRDRIVKLTKMKISERTDFVDGLIKRSDIMPGKLILEGISRDVQDDKFLACAVESKADYIVTGDEDLLVLKNYGEVKIVTPRQFLNILTGKR